MENGLLVSPLFFFPISAILLSSVRMNPNFTKLREVWGEDWLTHNKIDDSHDEGDKMWEIVLSSFSE